MAINIIEAPVVLLPGATWTCNETRTHRVWAEDNNGHFHPLRGVVGKENSTFCAVRPKETVQEAIDRLGITAKAVYVKTVIRKARKGRWGWIFKRSNRYVEVRKWEV